MNLGIIHCHLNRGGVTQVILNHLRALNEVLGQDVPSTVLLLHGGRREGFPEGMAKQFRRFSIIDTVIPELEYDEGSDAEPQPCLISEKVNRALRDCGCNPTDTLLHVHNHALGKNRSLPQAIHTLAALGYSLLLQIHDFLEDFRPVNYRRMLTALSSNVPETLLAVMYPQATQIHYAVLNGRDYAVLRDAGTEESRLHLLPNPVLPVDSQSDRETARRRLSERLGINERDRYVLSPVRGIRRKNLGESLLWSAVAPRGTAIGFTLAPLNLLEQPRYEHWRALARELRLPCYFGVGTNGLSLNDNFAACDRVLTTSVAEGFGFVFLEPFLAGRSIVGRDLPEITRDFTAGGMTFSGLHSRFSIPIDWINLDELRDGYEATFNSALQAYGRPLLSRSDLNLSLEDKVRNGSIDFGALTVEIQERVIRRVCGSPVGRTNKTDKEVLRNKNSWIADSFQSNELPRIEVESNARVIQAHYSLSAAGARLASIYHRVTESPRETKCSRLPYGGRILNTFLQPSRFHPVRL